MFGLLRGAVGSFTLAGPLNGISPGLATAIFLLAVVGFGLKAGAMPLHVWLPGAHANAPTHVSAIMSGVVIKMGIYGILRISGLFADPPAAWGSLLLVVGVASGVLGVVFAIAQHDLKRLLAYHSIENIGIILIGMGLALLGRSLGRPDWVALGLGGALLHVWNHAIFKPLLFFAGGSVIHAVHTRELDRMGGLAKVMPATSLGFLVGAAAICGLPPLNGFVSELLIYLGLFSTVGIGEGPSCVAAAAAAPGLAIIGALAVACFVKVFGVVFLGEPRSKAAEQAGESPRLMLLPMGVLAACCFTIGLAPALVAPILDRASAAWTFGSSVALPPLFTLVPLKTLSCVGLGLAIPLLVGTVVLRRYMLRDKTDVGTWDCGYAASSPRIQYTASSFAQILVDLFGWALRTKNHRPRIESLLAEPSRFESHTDDTVLDGAVLPLLRGAAALARLVGLPARGRNQFAILSILAAIVVLLIVAAGGNGGLW
jgi:hydrogenase-4 component B